MRSSASVSVQIPTPIVVDADIDIAGFHENNRPLCPVCQVRMRRCGVRRYPETGAIAFLYRCPTCSKSQRIKVHLRTEAPPSPTLDTMDAERVEELIRSVVGDDEDSIQDTWVAILEHEATTEDKVIELAKNVFTRRRSERIRSEHKEVDLSAYLEHAPHPGINYDGEEVALDRLGILGVQDEEQTEEDVSEPVQCVHCRSWGCVVRRSAVHLPDGRIERRYLCRVCWRVFAWPRRKPIPKRNLIHLNKQSADTEVDLSVVSRRELATKVRCHPGTVSQILSGRTTASLPLFYDIAKAIGCTMDELFRTISGANGRNPARLRYKRKPSWRALSALPPKYTVNGKGYRNLREALLSLGIERQCPTHYNALPPEIQAKIIRNRPHRGV